MKVPAYCEVCLALLAVEPPFDHEKDRATCNNDKCRIILCLFDMVYGTYVEGD